MAVELDVGAGEEVEGGLVESALWLAVSRLFVGSDLVSILFGTAKRRRSLRLYKMSVADRARCHISHTG